MANYPSICINIIPYIYIYIFPFYIVTGIIFHELTLETLVIPLVLYIVARHYHCTYVVYGYAPIIPYIYTHIISLYKYNIYIVIFILLLYSIKLYCNLGWLYHWYEILLHTITSTINKWFIIRVEPIFHPKYNRIFHIYIYIHTIPLYTVMSYTINHYILL